LYYLIFPSFFAIFVIIAHWLALKELGGEYAWIGVAFSFLVLLAWGDIHRSYGNFSFVRLFQGKSVLVSVCVPAVLYYAARFAKRESPRDWLLLGLAQTAALGFSASAIVAVPLTAAAYLFAATRLEPTRFKMLFSGLASSGVVVLMSAYVFMGSGLEAGLTSSGEAVSTMMEETDQGMFLVLSEGWRRNLAWFALLLAPVLSLSAPNGRTVNGYVLILVAVFLNPIVPSLLGTVAPRLIWRIFWAIPFPLLLGLLVQRLWGMKKRIAGVPICSFGAIAFALIFALAPGTWTLSPRNHTRMGYPRYKVRAERQVAKFIVDQTSSGDLVLAPYPISLWLPTFSGHPRLIGVRDFYYMPVAVFGDDNTAERKRMIRLISGWGQATERRMKRALDSIERLQVSVVVFSTHLAWRQRLADGLGRLGCVRTHVYQSARPREYEAWRCKPSSN
jgi:hypothetical protein